ncbi:hypothetical protein ABMY26_31750 [Azospirillum sp. HJ39]|uniref:hypothetical protein n=1 Tax=Azospirillum sp. HJ39 TaxID=3159496 RepID=UPI003557CFA3
MAFVRVGRATLVAAAMLSAAPSAMAEPMLFAPDGTAPLPAPPPAAAKTSGMPRTDALDCWLLDPDGLERAADRGLCGDAFARAPETASLPASVKTPPRKPKVPDSRSRASSRSESHATGRSPARIGRTGGGGDFFSNFQRDFRALTDLLGSGPSSGRGDGGTGSHMSHRR